MVRRASLAALLGLALLPASPAAAQVGAGCDPNYGYGQDQATGGWQCVPSGFSDVDCEGGDGPFWMSPYNRIPVVGADIYGLDRDGDKVACDPEKTGIAAPQPQAATTSTTQYVPPTTTSAAAVYVTTTSTVSTYMTYYGPTTTTVTIAPGPVAASPIPAEPTVTG